jgi:hypothetical protein
MSLLFIKAAVDKPVGRVFQMRNILVLYAIIRIFGTTSVAHNFVSRFVPIGL